VLGRPCPHPHTPGMVSRAGQLTQRSQARVSPGRRIFCHKNRKPIFCLSPGGGGAETLTRCSGFCVCCHSLAFSDLFSVPHRLWGSKHCGTWPSRRPPTLKPSQQVLVLGLDCSPCSSALVSGSCCPRSARPSFLLPRGVVTACFHVTSVDFGR